ncbi:MAG TPA: alanyl-tRNA editing protein, partial [Euzebya sp.]|nr:alanyl-tRNA editing protein [Euzebya sp.]
TSLQGQLDWQRRHQLMRTHTALHILCGVIWHDFGVAVTGGNMEPLTGRLDFELDAMSAELGQRVQQRINAEIEAARAIMVEFVARDLADSDPALIRTKANLIPAAIDPLRVIDILGLDRQADGGTHVATTAEVGRVEVVKTESKGKANKRIRLAVHDGTGQM